MHSQILENNWVWIRLAVLYANAALTYISATPPTVVPKDAKKVAPTGSETIFGRVLWTLPAVPFGYICMCLAESATLLAAKYPHTPVSQYILSTFLSSATHPTSHLTLPFLLGSASTIAGGLLRLQCYRTLAEHFTFQLSQLKNHKLITSGPYGVVRHPSYTGVVLVMLGMLISLFGDSGSWVRASGVLEPTGGATSAGWSWAGWLVKAWVVHACCMVSMLLPRAKVEDRFLKEKFGGEWEAYARRVPYWFVPGLI